jgi:hypothetical protein
VPVRAGPVFAATLKETAPLPTPLAPVTMEIQLAARLALQLQPFCVFTFTDPLPGFAVKDWPDEERVNVQEAPGVVWMTKF